MRGVIIHEMRLTPEAFSGIKNGKKTIEMRLCDEKRAKLAVGDIIVFENNETKEKMNCKIVAIKHFADFFDLYRAIDKVQLGYSAEETADPKDMYAYYSPERIKQYGVLAIEVELIPD